jgi:hypothetical protein
MNESKIEKLFEVFAVIGFIAVAATILACMIPA